MRRTVLREKVRQFMLRVLGSQHVIESMTLSNRLLAGQLRFVQSAVGLTELQRAEVADALRIFWRLITPLELEKGQLRRFGPPGDGGYVLEEDLTAISAVLSLGIGDNNSIDFELAHSFQKDVFAYDHTVDRLPMRHRRIYFRPVGVGEGTNLLPLAEIIEREDLGSRALLLCDIEGSELSKGFRHNLDLSRFKQISIELHNLGELFIRGRIPDLLSLVTSLTKDHQPIHIHANNFDSVNNFADLPLPETLEVTLVRRTDYRFGGRITRFPRDFDRPNSLLLPDTAWSIPENIFDEPGPAGAEASSRSPSNPPK